MSTNAKSTKLNDKKQVIVTISGKDVPGITSALTDILNREGVRLLEEGIHQRAAREARGRGEEEAGEEVARYQGLFPGGTASRKKNLVPSGGQRGAWR